MKYLKPILTHWETGLKVALRDPITIPKGYQCDP